MSEASKVTIGIFDSTGQTLVRSLQTAKSTKSGSYSIVWNGKNAAGATVTARTYVVKITATDAANKTSQVTGQITVTP